jgi:hypothetical protein
MRLTLAFLFLLVIACSNLKQLQPADIKNCTIGTYSPASEQREAFGILKSHVTSLQVRDAGDYCDVYVLLKKPVEEAGNKKEIRWLHCGKGGLFYSDRSTPIMDILRTHCQVGKINGTG